VVVLIAAGTFTGPKLIAIAKGMFVAAHEMSSAAVLESVAGVIQLASALMLTVLTPSLSTWATVYFTQAAFAGGVALTFVIWRGGVPALTTTGLRARVRDGIHLAIGQTALGAQFDSDKALLAKLADLHHAGVYGAAHRVTAVAVVPLMAFMGALHPRFFEAGANGYPEARRLAWRAFPIVFLYAVIVAGPIWIFAPKISFLLGSGFSEASDAIRLLVAAFILQCLQYPFADALTGSNRHATRTAVQVVVLTTSVVANLVLIPLFGWRGAATAATASHGLSLVLLLFAHNLPFTRPPPIAAAATSPSPGTKGLIS